MTTIVGSVNLPKDFKFENILRQNFTGDNIDKIICYDTCICGLNKVYGKLIIATDCIYTYDEAEEKISNGTHFDSVTNIEIINDLPKFIFGPMRNDCIHVRITKTKQYVIVKAPRNTTALCCTKINKVLPPDVDNNSVGLGISLTIKNDNTKLLNSNDNTKLLHSNQSSNLKIENEYLDYYILNSYTYIVGFLKKAYIDFLIRKTSESVISNTLNSELNYSQNITIRLFDNLILDLVNNSSDSSSQKRCLNELLEAGKRYFRIKKLFWSKSSLFQFLIEKFGEKLKILQNLMAISRHSHQPHLSNQNEIQSILECLDLFLLVFITFLSETDHLYNKFQMLRFNRANLILQLLKNIFELVTLINDVDNYDLCVNEPVDSTFSKLTINNNYDSQTIEIDLIKQELIINTISVFYYLIRSSQASFDSSTDLTESNTLSIRVICLTLESLTTLDSDEGYFNKFNMVVLRLIILWLFPDVYKIFKTTGNMNNNSSSIENDNCHKTESSSLNGQNKDLLESGQIVVIYQYFSSIKFVALCWSKVLLLLRQELKEEFFYFSVDNLPIPSDYPLSNIVVELIKSFQRNILNNFENFVE